MSDRNQEKILAFPMQNVNDGMELRDYFAARAMEALVSRGNYDPDFVSTCAYKIADAMMIKRKK